MRDWPSNIRVRVLDRHYLCDELYKKQWQSILHLRCQQSADHTWWIFSISVEVRNTEVNPAYDASRDLAVDSLIRRIVGYAVPVSFQSRNKVGLHTRLPFEKYLTTTLRSRGKLARFPLSRTLEKIAWTNCSRNSYHGLDSTRLWPGSCAIETSGERSAIGVKGGSL